MCVCVCVCEAHPEFRVQGIAGLTKRDIQLIVDGGFNTVESVAYTPRRVLEQIKGISEIKASKILAEGTFPISCVHLPRSPGQTP